MLDNHKKFLLPDELKNASEVCEMTDEEAVESIIELLDKFRNEEYLDGMEEWSEWMNQLELIN